MKISVFLLTALLLLSGASAEGDDLPASGGAVSLDSLLMEARQNNPSIQAAIETMRAAQETIPQARSFPDPMLRYTLFGSSIETRLGPQRNKISLSQTVPFFGKLTLKGMIAEAQSELLEAQYKGVVADVTLRVKELFFSLLKLDRDLILLEKERDLVKRLIKAAASMYEAGKAGQQDVLRSQLELTRLEDRQLEFRQSRRSTAALLNMALNRSADSPVPSLSFGSELPALGDKEELQAMALITRPEIKIHQSLITAREKRLELAKKNSFPDFQVMVEYVDVGGGTTMDLRDGRDAWMASVGVTLPLWRRKLKADRAEADNLLHASRSQLSAMNLETEAGIHDYLERIGTSEEQYALYKNVLLPQAEQTLKASESGYSAGRADFSALLESQRMILTVRMGIDRIFSEIWTDTARLERLVGRDLL